MSPFVQSLKLLRETLTALEGEMSAGNCPGYYTVRHAGEAALLLGFDSLANDFQRLLFALGPYDPLAGAITNISRVDAPPLKPLKLNTRPKIERDHPPFGPDYFSGPHFPIAIDQLSDADQHLQLALSGEVERAWELASGDEQIAEVLAIQAVRGQIESALEKVASLTPKDRDYVFYISAIELYRRQRFADARALIPPLPDYLACNQTRPRLALAVAGRVPWLGYPFP